MYLQDEHSPQSNCEKAYCCLVKPKLGSWMIYMTKQTNETQKESCEETEHGRLRTEIEIPKLPERAKSMNEENRPETKDQQETPKPELLVLKTGYGQHAMPIFL
jgi:hypothetical protein